MTKCTCPLCKRDERKVDEVLDEIQRIYNEASYKWDLCVECGDDAALEVNDLKYCEDHFPMHTKASGLCIVSGCNSFNDIDNGIKYCENHLLDGSYVQRRVDWAKTSDPATVKELMAEDVSMPFDEFEWAIEATSGAVEWQFGYRSESADPDRAVVFEEQKFTCMICKQTDCEGHVIRNDIPEAFLKAFEGGTNA
jgi:hypothetical protein